jgi:hypothetical protein
VCRLFFFDQLNVQSYSFLLLVDWESDNSQGNVGVLFKGTDQSVTRITFRAHNLGAGEFSTRTNSTTQLLFVAIIFSQVPQLSPIQSDVIIVPIVVHHAGMVF